MSKRSARSKSIGGPDASAALTAAADSGNISTPLPPKVAKRRRDLTGQGMDDGGDNAPSTCLYCSAAFAGDERIHYMTDVHLRAVHAELDRLDGEVSVLQSQLVDRGERLPHAWRAHESERLVVSWAVPKFAAFVADASAQKVTSRAFWCAGLTMRLFLKKKPTGSIWVFVQGLAMQCSVRVDWSVSRNGWGGDDGGSETAVHEQCTVEGRAGDWSAGYGMQLMDSDTARESTLLVLHATFRSVIPCL